VGLLVVLLVGVGAFGEVGALVMHSVGALVVRLVIRYGLQALAGRPHRRTTRRD
jgi:hypothetical protein